MAAAAAAAIRIGLRNEDGRRCLRRALDPSGLWLVLACLLHMQKTRASSLIRRPLRVQKPLDQKQHSVDPVLQARTIERDDIHHAATATATATAVYCDTLYALYTF